MINAIDIQQRRKREEILQWLAWKLPRRIAMWAAIRVIAHATQGEFSNTVVPELSAMEALRRWDE